MTEELLKKLMHLSSDTSKEEINDLAGSIMKAAGFPADIVDKIAREVKEEENTPEEHSIPEERLKAARESAKKFCCDICGIPEDEFNRAADATDEHFRNKNKSSYDEFLEAMSEAQGKNKEQLEEEIKNAPAFPEKVKDLVKCFIRQIRETPSICPNGLTKYILKECEKEGLEVRVYMESLCQSPFDVIGLKEY